MAYVGITASPRELAVTEGGALDCVLARRIAGVPENAPIVVLIHGYKFDPTNALRPQDNPHHSLFAFGADPDCRRVRSWPAGLGFDPDTPEQGLCIGFGWPAAEPHLPNLIGARRTGFAQVYDRAADCGARLAELIARVQALRPDRPVDVMAHSLGARVALAALDHLETAPGRMILLGAAEFDSRAREALAAVKGPRLPQVYNVTARANDFYDAMFETFAPRRSWRERAVGQGLREPLPCWLDLQLDRADLTDRINAMGIALMPARTRMCHWSFYTRSGAFDVYQAILRRKPGWDIADLRVEPGFAAQEPRWSRIAPRARAPRPRFMPLAGAGAGLGRA